MQPYAIVGATTGELIGVCTDPCDVLAEEPPGTRFIEISPAEFDGFEDWTNEQQAEILTRPRFTGLIEPKLTPALTQAQMIWHMGFQAALGALENYLSSFHHWEHQARHGKKDERPAAAERVREMRVEVGRNRDALSDWVTAHPYPKEEGGDAAH